MVLSRDWLLSQFIVVVNITRSHISAHNFFYRATLLTILVI